MQVELVTYEVLPSINLKPLLYKGNPYLVQGQVVQIIIRGKSLLGMIVGLSTDHPEFEVREITQVYDLILTASQIKLINSISAYYMVSAGNVLKMLLSGYSKGRCASSKPKELDIHQSDVPPTALSDSCVSSGHTTILRRPIELNRDQEQAFEHLKHEEGFVCYLLFGITGSGKTEVYFKYIAQILSESGTQILIMVPEIGLTSAFLKRIQDTFSVPVYMYHSMVSSSKSKDAFSRAHAGERAIFFGTRSSLFLSFKNLKLIIVDEEHDSSYKQESNVIYSAKDSAILYAKIIGIPIILGSATPSVESFYMASQGTYKLIKLQSRHNQMSLPEVKVIDMRGQAGYISRELILQIQRNIEQGNQSMLFINKRGYCPMMACMQCSFTFRCSTCDFNLVFHEKSSKLICHYCNKKSSVPPRCPACQAEGSLRQIGPGVERIKEELQIKVPEARTILLSTDYITTPAKMNQAIDLINNKEVNVIIGTQIIAKGHNFADITLVGILNMDPGFESLDLKASEKSFQITTQALGRAGRIHKEGLVMLQTYSPHSKMIGMIKSHDTAGFYDAELQQRKQFNLPPFFKIIRIIISSTDKAKCLKTAHGLHESLSRYTQLSLLGPSPCSVSMIKGKYRMNLIVKYKRGIHPQSLISKLISNVGSSMDIKVDVDPQSTM